MPRKKGKKRPSRRKRRPPIALLCFPLGHTPEQEIESDEIGRYLNSRRYVPIELPRDAYSVPENLAWDVCAMRVLVDACNVVVLCGCDPGYKVVPALFKLKVIEYALKVRKQVKHIDDIRREGGKKDEARF